MMLNVGHIDAVAAAGRKSRVGIGGLHDNDACEPGVGSAPGNLGQLIGIDFSGIEAAIRCHLEIATDGTSKEIQSLKAVRPGGEG
jgi:hypothetical protein